MNEETVTPATPEVDEGQSQGGPSRRQVLAWMGIGAAGVAVAGTAAWRRYGNQGPTTWSRSQKLLVVIELGGGNDGWSTLAPFGDGRYHDLRPTMALDGDEVIDLGEGWGLHRNLRGLNRRGLTLVTGVGTNNPNMSHFEMAERWSRGDIEGTADVGAGRSPTGFLGRLCDAVGSPGTLTGLSLRFGDSPAMVANKAATIGVGDVVHNPFDDDDAAKEFRANLELLTAGSGGAATTSTRKELGEVIELLDLVESLPDTPTTYPDNDLGKQLAFTSRLVQADAGLRVIHVPMGAGSLFDTHKNHRNLHDGLMKELNGGLSAFVDDLEEHGVADQVLIATTSEFGRRSEEHGDGLDHGTASTMLMMGPTRPGVFGEHSSLRKLDADDNLVATQTFDRYYATLATWLGVDPGDVLPAPKGRAPAPIPGLLA